MSMEWVRKTYGVPAKRGMRVVYTGGGAPVSGTIRSARTGRLKIQMDGAKSAKSYHPTWELSYPVSTPAPATH